MPVSGHIDPSAFILACSGEVQEWLNWQHWKCCERETVPWVRIPPSPPDNTMMKRTETMTVWPFTYPGSAVYDSSIHLHTLRSFTFRSMTLMLYSLPVWQSPPRQSAPEATAQPTHRAATCRSAAIRICRARPATLSAQRSAVSRAAERGHLRY